MKIKYALFKTFICIDWLLKFSDFFQNFTLKYLVPRTDFWGTGIGTKQNCHKPIPNVFILLLSFISLWSLQRSPKLFMWVFNLTQNNRYWMFSGYLILIKISIKLLLSFNFNNFILSTRCTVWWTSSLLLWTTTTQYLSQRWDSSATTVSRRSSSSRTMACTVHQLCSTNSQPSTSCPQWTKSTSCYEAHSPREAEAASFTCMTLLRRSVLGDNPVTPEITGTPIGTLAV